MTQQRRFTTGAFGPDHLGPDAVVAFVDDELARRPHERAVVHVDSCPQCRAEVVAQRRARTALRAADCPSLPSSLLSSLRSIPQSADLPQPPAGLAVGPDGDVVSVLRPCTPPLREEPRSRSGVHHSRHPARRTRLGAGVAVSGLAIGALAFGATAVTTGPDPDGAGGSVLSPAGAAFGVDPRAGAGDTRLSVDSTVRPRTFLLGGTAR